MHRGATRSRPGLPRGRTPRPGWGGWQPPAPACRAARGPPGLHAREVLQGLRGLPSIQLCGDGLLLPDGAAAATSPCLLSSSFGAGDAGGQLVRPFPGLPRRGTLVAVLVLQPQRQVHGGLAVSGLPREASRVPLPLDGSSSDSSQHGPPPRKHAGHLGPAVAQHLVGLTHDVVLLLRPAGLLHLGVEVVVPALTALPARPASQVLGDQRPPLRDQLDGRPLWSVAL